MWSCACDSVYVEVRGQPAGGSSLLPCRSWSSRSGDQCWQQAPSLLSCLPAQCQYTDKNWGRKPGLGAAQAHSWDTSQDGDRHDRIGAEELPPSLQELKDTWLVTRQALDGGTQACLLKKMQPPTSALPPSPWNEAGSGHDTDSRLSSADSWLG